MVCVYETSRSERKLFFKSEKKATTRPCFKNAPCLVFFTLIRKREMKAKDEYNLKIQGDVEIPLQSGMIIDTV